MLYCCSPYNVRLIGSDMSTKSYNRRDQHLTTGMKEQFQGSTIRSVMPICELRHVKVFDIRRR